MIGRLSSTRAVFLGLLAAGALSAVSAAAAAAEAPHWGMITRLAPTHLAPGAQGEVVGVLVNLGDSPVLATQANPVTITAALPSGLRATGSLEGYATRGDNEESHPEDALKECTSAPVLSCKYIGRLDPFIAIEVHVRVEATGAPGEQTTELKAEGANAPARSIARPVQIDSSATTFGVERFELTPEEEDGSLASQAGSHPFQLTTTIELNQTMAKDPDYFKIEEAETHKTLTYPSAPALLRNLNTTLPAGLVADARSSVVPQCSAVAFATLRLGNSNTCPANTAVGAAAVTFKEELHFRQYTSTVPVFNLVPEKGEPARFGFVFEKVPVILDTSLNTGAGYAVQVKVQNSSQAAELLSTIVTIWGVPGDPRHGNARGWECLGNGYYVEGLEPRPKCAVGTPNLSPYLILPATSCTQHLEGSVSAQSWTESSFSPEVGLSDPLTQQGCERLPFEPTISAQPDQKEASTPTGLNVEVKVPQTTTLATTGLAEADIASTTVQLPEEMISNAGAADGLVPCGVAGAGFENPAGSAVAQDSDTGATLTAETQAQSFTPAAAACPDAAKVGTVSIKTPLLDNELKGYVYFGLQNTNPFASPLVLYLIAEDPESGVRVKLAGEVEIDQATGQLTSHFKNTPPVPFETLDLHLTNGPRATQSTPAYCNRAYTTTATFVPSTGEASKQGSSSFALTPNADGQPCPSPGQPLPFAPGMETTSSNTQAGGFTAFSLTVRKPDGDQPLRTVGVTMPPGLAAILASVTPCPEPQAANDQCGPGSLIGHSTASSGLGSDPVTLGGDVYLTGPYKGAPFGLLAVTHAIAGPFNLGDVPVRSTININPYTAAVTVASDPLPQFVKGVPSQIKVLNVTIDRAGFEFNPTNCTPKTVTGTLGGYGGAAAPVASGYAVANCAALPFAPKLTASAGGHGSKLNGVGFNVTLTSAGLGQAGIEKVFLTIPKILPSRLTTIQKACPDKLFEANPATCDEGSLIGKATIHTPVFKNPLTGPAYLVSHGNAAFPDVEFVLQGEGVTIILDGKTDIKKGVTYSRFESSPDAPFTSFETSLPAGPHSALTINTQEGKNYEICSKNVTLPTVLTGQNGVVINQTKKVAITGCGAVKGFKASRAAQLAKALKACRKQFKHSKAKRAACEKKAHKKFGPKKAKKKASKKSKKK